MAEYKNLQSAKNTHLMQKWLDIKIYTQPFFIIRLHLELPELRVLLITHRIDLMKGNLILQAAYSAVRYLPWVIKSHIKLFGRAVGTQHGFEIYVAYLRHDYTWFITLFTTHVKYLTALPVQIFILWVMDRTQSSGSSLNLSSTIIRRFLRNRNIMWMTLLVTRCGNLHKLRFL